MQKYKYYNFFDKNGNYCNFDYDEDLDRWKGRIDLNIISEGLIEDYQLFIMEEVYNLTHHQYEYTKPIVDVDFLAPNGPDSGIVIIGDDYIRGGSTSLYDYINNRANKLIGEFQSEVPIPELFLYDFNLKETNIVLNKQYSLLIDCDLVNYTKMSDIEDRPGMKKLNIGNVNAIPLQINIGFQPSSEDLFGNYLYIKDAVGHIIAEIFVYGESVEEDERLTNLLQSMGYDLLPGDFMIFEDSDVNEIKPDWKIVNQKRKELLLEHDNIFPFIGSYKALVNIIKFFGYQNLRMKEYWINIDETSSNFGKFKQIDINDVFGEDANYNPDIIGFPNKVYRKSNKFGLFYDLTVESGEYDDDGLPLTLETFTFSPQEILIKIFALKQKLQNYFLGVNSRIVDIIGESIYFAKYEINVWNDQQRIDNIELGIHPTFEVLPSTNGMIEDLRPLLTFGFPVGSDVNMGGYSNLNMWRVGIGDSINIYGPNDSEQYYELNFKIPGTTSIIITSKFSLDLDTGKYIYEKNEIADNIIKNIKNNDYLNTNLFVYQEGGTSGIIRLVQKTAGGTGEIFSKWYSNTSPSGPGFGKYSIPGSIGGTSYHINISPGGTFGSTGAPISYYGDSILGYFDNKNFDIKKLNDDEDIPVGSPFVLNNTSFNITWDDADISFNQIDKKNSVTNKLLFGNFKTSKTITGWTAGSQPIYSTVSGFPSSSYPSRNNYTWNNLAQYGYYEMQWKVYFDNKLVIDSGRDLIEKISKYPIILPKVGKYKVELHLWDDYNTKSSKIINNVIEVEAYESDFIGWYKKLENKYNLDTRRYMPNGVNSRRILPGGFLSSPEIDEYLTWDEYTSTWDLPFHPNEELDMMDLRYNSLDSLEFYKSIKNPSEDPLVDRFAYKYNLMGSEATLDDLYHLWWDSMGTNITQFNINGVTGPTAYIAMSRGNSIYNTKSTLYIVDGPTGYTGSIGSTSLIGNTGDILHSYSNNKTFVFNKGQWNLENEYIDVYRATGLTGGNNQMILELVRQLNINMPNEKINGVSSHKYLEDFIYTYNQEYVIENNQLILRPYIRAISKDIQSSNRHKIRYISATGDNKSYETVNFGYIGDQPTYFEIYDVSSTSLKSILIKDISGKNTIKSPVAYNIGATNLYDAFKELCGPTAQKNEGISKFTYSLVTNYPGAIGSTSIGATAYYTKIQAVSKAYASPSKISVEYSNINGTTYGRSLIKNITLDEIKILKYTEELPICTTVNFTYDSSKMKGKKNPIWILRKEDDSLFDDIYYNNKYFSYMFNQKGSYSLTLQLEDSNGNKKEITKKEIIKII